MSERIEVGDLVVVVRASPCCNSSKAIGRIFTVKGFTDFGICGACGTSFRVPFVFEIVGKRVMQLDRVKRIPPLTELQERREEVEA